MDNKELLTSSYENEESYLFFELDKKVYAFNSIQTVEIIELPKLEYPEKLSKHIVGILNYNNLIINVVDLKTFLNIPTKPYSTDNQVVIVSSNESIFGIVIDKILDIKTVDKKCFQAPPFVTRNNYVKAIYNDNQDIVTIINIDNIEVGVKESFGGTDTSFMPPTLMPDDEKSLKVLKQRTQRLSAKSTFDIQSDLYESELFVTFKLENNVYCINLKEIREFTKANTLQLTPIPCTPDFISGVVSLKGEFITVVDLKNFLGKGKTTSLEKSSMLTINSNELHISLMIEGTIEMATFFNEELRKKKLVKYDSPYTLAEIVKDNVLYIVLDTSQILKDDRLFIKEVNNV